MSQYLGDACYNASSARNDASQSVKIRLSISLEVFLNATMTNNCVEK